MKRRVIRKVLRDRLTYLDRDALVDLDRIVRDAERRGLHGSVVETGCALGGSALVMVAAKNRERPMFVYDTFGMIPAPSASDGDDVQARYEVIASGESAGIGGDTYYGYEPDLLGKVAGTFRRYGLDPQEHSVHFIEGLYEDTLHPEGPVAVAHIDCDWYESVRTCLSRLAPFLVVGGRFVIDDYDHWSGCRRAVDEFMTERYRMERHARVHLVKLRDNDRTDEVRGLPLP